MNTNSGIVAILGVVIVLFLIAILLIGSLVNLIAIFHSFAVL